MKIRLAKSNDTLNIKYLKTQVWLHTYATKGINDEYSEYLEADFTQANCLKSICDKNKCCLVAEENDLLVAYCEIDFKVIHPDTNENCAELTVLYVSEHFCGHGIGKALLHETEKQLITKGHTNYWLSCFIENEYAIGFYQHMGFKSNSSIYFSMGDSQYENVVFHKDIEL